MEAERWRQIDKLFDAVLEVSPEQRDAFVAEKCGTDEDLKREVLSLLAAQKATDGFMEKSAMNLMAKEIAHNQTTVIDFSIVGKILGNYQIERPLGAGGMGEVYLAHDTKLKRHVALKILPAAFVLDEERIKRFEREARAISALNHPNIVTIYDFGQADGINYIVTEFIEGKTVRELIGKNLTLKETLLIVAQTCDALSAAHQRGIIHRDIKPENIMVRPDGYVKVLDFGLAKLNPTGDAPNTLSNYTQKGMIIGTLAYMSPEQISDDHVDHRTDLWSLGVVLYEMLTGKNPFKGGNRQATLNAILSFTPPPVSETNAALHADLDAILNKALEKDADLSYQTASDIRADLRRVRRELDSSTSLRSDKSQNSQTILSKKKNRFLYASAALILILTTAAIWFLHYRWSSSNASEAIEWLQGNHTQLTFSPWIEGYPSLSPDGKFIVFASEVEGDRNIYRQRIGGKNPSNLTPDSKESDTMPAFSPDGKYIAFRSERSPSGIYTMEETGENARRVSDLGFHPSWSPDNTKIVVSDRAAAIHTVHTIPNSSLFIIDVKSGDRQKLETGGDAIMPNWSPHGERIAFWFVADGKAGDIATVPANGGEPIVVAEDAAADWNPVWSPDGKYLYFASDRKGSMNLWRIPIDEKTGKALGAAESIPSPTKYCRHITFSRDGKILAYVRYESHSNLQSIAFDPQNLKAAREINWITRVDNEVGYPDISPNGAEFVVRQPTQTQEDLTIFDRNGGNWRNLTDDKFRERLPRWSPDGAKIAFNTDRSGKYQIWTINPDGSNSRQITFSEQIGATAAVFSPDGSQMAFTEIGSRNSYSSILDLSKSWAEQKPVALANPNNYSFSVRDWSGDGKKLLCIFFETDGDENGIGVYDLESKKFEKIIENGNSPFWLKDNRHFIFTDRNAIFLGDAQTKNAVELYKTAAYEIQHANISPDNKLIFFRYLQANANVWMIESSSIQ